MTVIEYLAALLAGTAVPADRELEHRAVQALVRAEPAGPTELRRRIALLSGLSGICLSRPDSDTAAESAQDAVLAASTAARLSAESGFAFVEVHSNLALALRRRFEIGRDSVDLEAAVEAVRMAAAAAASDDPDYIAVLVNLSALLRLQAQYTAGSDGAQLVDEALQALRTAFGHASAQNPYLPAVLSNLIALIGAKAASGVSGGQVSELKEALALASHTLQVMPEDHPERTMVLAGLSDVFRGLYRADRTPEYLAKAQEASREAFSSATGEDRLRFGNSLAALLKFTHEENGDLEALSEGIAILVDLVDPAAQSPDSLLLPMIQVNLAGALCTRFHRSQAERDLDDALNAARRGYAAFPTGHRDSPAAAANLAAVLHARFRLTGELESVYEEITLLQGALDLGSADGTRAEILGNLAIALTACYRRIGETGQLDQAVEMASEAVRLTAVGSARAAHFLSVHGATLRSAYDATGEPVLLDQAILLGTRSVGETPEGHPDLPRRLSHLSIALLRRFDRTGSEPELLEAVRLGREAAAALPDHDSLVARARNNLGNALRARFEFIGELADLDEAAELLQEVVAGTPDSSMERPLRLANLSTLMLRRFEATDRPADLDNAVRYAVAAAQAAGRADPAMPMYYSNLALTLFRRFEAVGGDGDLEAAVAAGRATVHTAGGEHPALGGFRSNLIAPLLARYERGGDEADLEEAIALGRSSVAELSDESQAAAGLLFNLAMALRSDNREDHGRSHAEAAELFERCAALPAAAPLWRAAALIQRGQLALADREWLCALRFLTSAVDLVPQIADHALTRASRQARLGRLDGIGRAAAAAAIELGQPASAMSILEHARGVILRQGLEYRIVIGKSAADQQFTRSLTTLRNLLDNESDSTAWPGVARRQEDVEGGPGPAVVPLAPGSGTLRRDLLLRRREAARRWDQLTAGSRERGLRSGAAGLFQAPDSAELSRAAGDGVIIAVNVTATRCDALVLDADGVHPSIRLPELTMDECVRRVNGLLDALNADDWDTNVSLTDLLAWMWETIAEPVLTGLGLVSPPGPGSAWPRVWWMPTGPLALAPIHAAGHMAASGTSPWGVLDLAISSYTPTLRSLTHARAQAARYTQRSDGPTRPLILGVTDTPGQRPLVRAAVEAETVATLLGRRTGKRYRPLIDGQATMSKVIEALRSCDWAHFACHSQSAPLNPSENSLLLHDAPLTVQAIAALDNPDAYLAYLSSCANARSGARLPDESIHVAATTQLAGFAHVIGTMWQVGDDNALLMARTVYPHLLRHPHSPAEDLHHAVRELRDRYPGNPLFWAPYAHFGP